MKKVTKFFMVALLAGMCSFGYAQDVKVNINNQETSVKDDCPRRINGVCVSEDIGGVDVQFLYHQMILTNYNSFPVTVIWQISYENPGSCCSSLDGTVRTGTMVLGIEGVKAISVECCENGWSVDGLIVRKLAQ